MPKRSSTPSPTPQPAVLTNEQRRKGIRAIQKRIELLRNFRPEEMVKEDEVYMAAKPLRASIETALTNTFGTDSAEAKKYDSACFALQSSSFFIGGSPTPFHETQNDYVEGRETAIALLSEAIENLEEQLEDGLPRAEELPLDNTKVFIVHGRDEVPKLEVEAFVHSLGLKPVVLHRQPNLGRSLLEKFKANSNVGFAIVLLTPDDVGGLDPKTLTPRARQNVILEMGFFLGKLPPERVCVLKKADVEIPSDYAGIVYHEFDGSGGWRFDLAKELLAVGYDIDLRKAMQSAA